MIQNIRKWVNIYNSNLCSGEPSVIVCSSAFWDYTPHVWLLFIWLVFKHWRRLLFLLLPPAFSFLGWILLFLLPRAWFSGHSQSCAATSDNQCQFVNILHGDVVFQMDPSIMGVWVSERRVVVMSLGSDFTLMWPWIILFCFIFFLKSFITGSVWSWIQTPSPSEIFHLDSLSQVSHCYTQ